MGMHLCVCVYLYQFKWACKWMCVTSFRLSHTHENESRRICKRLMKNRDAELFGCLTQVQCVWSFVCCKLDSFKELEAAGMWKRDKLPTLITIFSLRGEKVERGLGMALAMSVPCQLFKTGSVVLATACSRSVSQLGSRLKSALCPLTPWFYTGCQGRIEHIQHTNKVCISLWKITSRSLNKQLQNYSWLQASREKKHSYCLGTTAAQTGSASVLLYTSAIAISTANTPETPQGNNECHESPWVGVKKEEDCKYKLA